MGDGWCLVVGREEREEREEVGVKERPRIIHSLLPLPLPLPLPIIIMRSRSRGGDRILEIIDIIR